MSKLIFTLIQTNLFWENPSQNLLMLSNKIESITAFKQVVILPEMFSTGFSMQPHKLAETMQGNCITWMKNEAKKHKIILCGSLMIKEDDKYYNRFIWMQPNGSFSFYDKKHLFAFAGEHEHYTAGKTPIITQANGLKIKPLICYDLRFPVWARQQTTIKEELYDVLIYVANWPEKRSHAWKHLLIARAIENQCYVIGVNRVGADGNNVQYAGDSMIINPLGEIVYQKNNEEDIFTYTIDKAEIDKMRDQFPFYKGSDEFNIPL